jgi:WD40 repeat protein
LLGISGNGKRIYTDSWESTQLKAWDTASGQIVFRETIPPEEQRILTISPDKLLVATQSEKSGVMVRSLQNHQVVRRFPDHVDDLRSTPPRLMEAYTAGFSGDNHILAVADSFGGMRLYDLTTGQRLASPINDMNNEGQAVSEVAIREFQFSADDHYLFVSKPKKLPLIWDLKNKKKVKDFEPLGEDIKFATILEQQHQYLLLQNDREKWFSQKHTDKDGSFGESSWKTMQGTVRISDLFERSKQRSFPVEQTVEHAAVSNDGKLLATTGYHSSNAITGNSGSFIILWDLRTGKRLTDVSIADGAVQLAFLPDNQTLVSVGKHVIRLWNVTTDTKTGQTKLIDHRHANETYDRITDLQFTKEDDQLLIVSNSGVGVWKTTTPERLQKLGDYDDYAGNTLAFDALNKRLFLGTHSTVSVWVQQKGKWLQNNKPDSSFRTEWICHALSLTPDGSTLVIGNRKTEMYTIAGKFPDTFEIKDAQTFESVGFASATYDKFTHQDIAALSHSSDGKVLAVAYGPRVHEAKKVAIIDPRQRYAIVQEIEFDRGHVFCLAISPKRSLVAVGGGRDRDWRGKQYFQASDHGITLYAPIKTEPLRHFEGHTGPALALAFSPDGKWLVSGSQDQSIRLWDVATGQEKLKLAGHNGPVSAVKFSPNGKFLATGSWDTTTILWDFDKLVSQMPNR